MTIEVIRSINFYTFIVIEVISFLSHKNVFLKRNNLMCLSLKKEHNLTVIVAVFNEAQKGL